MSPTIVPNSRRDQRIDFLRGIALVTIFVNHVPGNPLESFTSRNFGFSDAAEAFVLMSGMAAGYAYFKASSDSVVAGLRKSAARAAKLYWVHMLISALAIIGVVCASTLIGNFDMLSKNNFEPVFTMPWTAVVSMFALSHQFGYFNILPLYCLLILISPLLISIGKKRPMAVLAASAALWLAAGYSQTNLPTYPVPGGWFLDPLSWQLIFTIGVLTSVMHRQGKSLVPYSRGVFAIAVAYVLFSAVIVKGEYWDLVLFPAYPEIVAGFNKMYLTLPRLMHVLSLAYILAYWRPLGAISATRIAAPFKTLGANSLPVFATGSVLCIVAQTLKASWGVYAPADIAMVVVGLLMQYGAARVDELRSWLSERVSEATSQRRSGI